MSAREQHTVLLLSAITAEAHADRLTDAQLRAYIKEVTENADLPPRRLTVVPDGPEAA